MKVLILAGGIGTRLWPLSRDRFPKQFIKFHDKEHSLFQETFKRSLLLADLDDIYIVTNRLYQFLVRADVEELGYQYQEDHILTEPEVKNTLPASKRVMTRWSFFLQIISSKRARNFPN